MNLVVILQLNWNPKLEQGFALSLLQKALVLLAQYFNAFLPHIQGHACSIDAVLSLTNNNMLKLNLIFSYLLKAPENNQRFLLIRKIKAADFKKPFHKTELQQFCGWWDYANTMLCT